ncbi:salicylate synthase [Nocardia sp. NPDC003963]
MIEYDTETISFRHDPIGRVARLARTDFDEYVVYERAGEYVFAGGALATISLDAQRVHYRCGDEEYSETWSGSSGGPLQRALSRLPIRDWHAYGRIDFGFAEIVPGLRLQGTPVPPGELIRLIVPRVEVRLNGQRAFVRSVDPVERERVLICLSASPEPVDHVVEQIDVRGGGPAYRERVAQAVKEIRQGQYQKVILSRSVQIPFPIDHVATYELGRRHNAPARSFLLRLNGIEAAGFSPEVIVTVDRDRKVTTQPLAGTRAFGLGTRADAAARLDLETNPKEIYEHAVSVRTAVAELAPICRSDSVHVQEFMGVRERGSVQHLASLVTGSLAADRTVWDALEAVFPGVTASGIPKRESLDAIARMDDPRGLYSGAVLGLSQDGTLDAALVLRAVYQEGDRAWLRAGAGIVADSTPEREFEETCEKLASVAPYIVSA